MFLITYCHIKRVGMFEMIFSNFNPNALLYLKHPLVRRHSSFVVIRLLFDDGDMFTCRGDQVQTLSMYNKLQNGSVTEQNSKGSYFSVKRH